MNNIFALFEQPRYTYPITQVYKITEKPEGMAEWIPAADGPDLF